ncbi:MAG: AAA family ATPase [Alistipes finegoldii]
MKLVSIVINNYKGIQNETKIMFHDFCCIVGRNDVGKSTILKALNVFLNDHSPSFEDKNIYNESTDIEIELQFDCCETETIIDESIPITFVEEELVNADRMLCLKKVWDVSQKTIKPKVYIVRKIYENDDFALLSESALMALCKKYNIETQKGNGSEFNNKEKRSKLRSFYMQHGYNYSYQYEELPTTGQTRMKKILEGIKDILPTFEYFKADSSLSDSDTSVQKYFKDKAFKLLKEEIDTDNIEQNVRVEIEKSLKLITEKINSVLSAEEQISAKIDFDWSKLISTSFKCNKEEGNIPLNSRGDGFRRITMMSYFEMLAEEKNHARKMIFGFEEPETFLHSRNADTII